MPASISVARLNIVSSDGRKYATNWSPDSSTIPNEGRRSNERVKRGMNSVLRDEEKKKEKTDEDRNENNN